MFIGGTSPESYRYLPSFNLRRSSLSKILPVAGQVGVMGKVIQNVFLAVDGVEPLLLRRKSPP